MITKDHVAITYRRHNCTRKHRTHRALAKCIWRQACWIQGQGAYASVAYCRVTTVQLWATEDEARDALQIIDSSACGGGCHGYSEHRLIHLDIQ